MSAMLSDSRTVRLLRRATPGFIQRLTIAQQLRLGFGVGGAILLVVGLTTAVLLRVMTSTLGQTVQEVGQNQRTIGTMRDALSTENSGVQGFLITGDESYLARFDQGHRDFQAAAALLAQQPAVEDPAAARQYQASASDISALEQQFNTLGLQEIDLYRTNFQQTAAFDWQREGEPAQTALRARLDGLVASRLQLVQNRLSAANTYEWWTRLVFAPIVALAAGIGMLIAFLAGRGLTRRFRHLEADVARIEDGDFKLDPIEPGHDEFSRLGASIRKMAATLDADTRERETLLAERARSNAKISALYDVAVTLNQSLEPDEVLGTALAKLVEYTGMSGGIAYLIDEQTGRFRQTLTAGISEEIAVELAGYIEEERVQQKLRELLARPGLTHLDTREVAEYQGPYRTSVVVPVRAKGRELGLLALVAYEHLRVSDDAVQLIEGLAKQIGTALEHARLYSRSRQLAVTEERNRLARDLHDSVTQTLFSMSMMAQALPSMIERQPDRAAERAGRLGDLSRGALAEMRMLILELRPAALQEMGLVMALQRHVDGWSSREGIEATLRVDGLQRRLPHGHEEALFRVAQEALTNIAKHAQATCVFVSLYFAPETVALTVRDNGVGMPAEVDGSGFGLTSMRERVEALGGTFRAAALPDAGTEVGVCVAAPPPSTSITA